MSDARITGAGPRLPALMTKLQLEGTIQTSLASRGGLERTDPAYAGQADYTPAFLAHVYDPLVLRFANRFVWRCPSRHILSLYAEHLTGRHLDVGPGTGWFLERCEYPTPSPELTLLDVNADVLEAASARLSRYAPHRHQANLLEPLDADLGTFDSIALTHVLHCLPGGLADKRYALEQLAGRLAPGGAMFGTTVLGGGVPHTPLSRAFLRFLNGKGVFSNRGDDLAGLERALAGLGGRFRVETRGAVALFVVTA